MVTAIQQKTSETTGLVNDREIARLLGLSVGTIRRWRLLRRGCPYVKLGTSIRYCVADVRKWIAEREIRP